MFLIEEIENQGWRNSDSVVLELRGRCLIAKMDG